MGNNGTTRRSFLQQLALGGLAVAFGTTAAKRFDKGEAYAKVEATLKATEQLYAKGGNPDTVIWHTDFGPMYVVDSREKLAQEVLK